LKPTRKIDCIDCGAAVLSTSNNVKRCAACRKKAAVNRTIACQRRTRDKYALGRFCIVCGVQVNAHAVRCALCQADHKAATVNGWHDKHKAERADYMKEYKERTKGLDGAFSCRFGVCDSCPFPDCILPHEADELPVEWVD